MQSSVVDQIRAVVSKDLRRELRTREVTTTTIAFSVLLMVIFAFAFYKNDESVALIFPGILWVSIIFASTIAITRTFDQEKDGGCLRALALIPGTEVSLYLGKLIINLMFLGIFEVVLVPLIALSFDVPLFDSLLEYSAVVASVTLGFAAIGTLVSAMLVHSHLRDVMLPILLYPLAVPLLIAGVKVTAMIFNNEPSEHVWTWIRVVAGADVLFIFVSVWLFRWVLSAIE